MDIIHTNERQWLGALAAECSCCRNSRNPDRLWKLRDHAIGEKIQRL